MLKVSSRIIHSQQAIPTLSTANRRAQPEGHPGRHGPCGDRHDYQRVCPYPGLGPEGERPEVRGRLLRQRQSRPADGAPSGKNPGAEGAGECVAGSGGPGGTAPQVAGTGQHPGRIAGGGPIRKIGRKNRFSKVSIFISKIGKNVRSQLAEMQRKMYKIVPAERQGRPKEMIIKTAVNHRKTAYSGHFGTPGETRTHYIPLRRRTLYPGEVRGHIQKTFHYEGLQGSNGSIVRSTAYHFVNCSYHIFPYCFFANCAAWRQVNLHKFP